MKTKTWVLLITLVAMVCLGLSVWLFRLTGQAAYVKVISEGKVLHTLPLNEDTQLEVASTHGTNTVTIKDGKVAVTQADCPDKHCMNRGFCDGGAQIVCLPNRLVLEFIGNSDIDGISG